MQSLKSTRISMGGGNDSLCGFKTGTPATTTFEKLAPNSSCYEYSVQKFMGMTAEECVILAIALDFHMGKDKPPLAGEIAEVATMEQESGAMTCVRILVVLDK